MKRFGAALAACALVVGAGAGSALADGTETLGTPSVPVAAGTGLLAAGVGTEAPDGQPASFSFAVPAGASVKQVLLYWTGHYSAALGSADGTINVASGTPAAQTFGRTAAGTGLGCPGANFKYGSRFTLAVDGYVTTLHALMTGGGSGSQVFRTMLYDDDGAAYGQPAGRPGTLLAVSQEVTVPGSAPQGDVAFPLAPKVFLQAGDYWIMQQSGPAGLAACLSQVVPSPTGAEAPFNVDAYADGPSDPAGALNPQSADYTLWATYEPAGASVAGTLIGGPTRFFTSGANDANFATYRADISSLGLVGAGANTLTVGGLDFRGGDGFGNDGAGVVVVYDDGSGASIALRDGQDMAFDPAACCLHAPTDIDPGERQTVAQTFTFAPATIPRTAALALLAASVEGPASAGGTQRPNRIRVTFDSGAPVEILNPFGSFQGAEYDAANLTVTIPAGAAQATVQALSLPDPQAGGFPASFAWSAAGLVVPPAPPPPAKCSLGDFVWMDKDQDGIQDDGAWSGVNGVAVELLAGATVVATTTTGNKPDTGKPGWYRFEVTCGTTYVVRVAASNFTASGPLGGTIGTIPNNGSNDAVDSDGDLVNHASHAVTLAPNTNDPTIDFGFVKVCDPPKHKSHLQLACLKLDLFIAWVRTAPRLSNEKRQQWLAAAIRLKQYIGCR